MTSVFNASAIKRLESLFGVPAKSMGTNYRFEIAASGTEHAAVRRLALEIYPDIPIGKKHGNLISVYTEAAHLQLHFCTAFVISEDLGEATFVGDHEGKLSGLIVEKTAGCTLFANVDRGILSGDFTRLAPEVMLSGVALSLTEHVLESPKRPPRRGRAPARRSKSSARQ